MPQLVEMFIIPSVAQVTHTQGYLGDILCRWVVGECSSASIVGNACTQIMWQLQLFEQPANGIKSCVYETENCSPTTELSRKASSKLDLNWPPSKASLVDCLVALRYKLHKLHLADGDRVSWCLWTAFSWLSWFFHYFHSDGTWRHWHSNGLTLHRCTWCRHSWPPTNRPMQAQTMAIASGMILGWSEAGHRNLDLHHRLDVFGLTRLVGCWLDFKGYSYILCCTPVLTASQKSWNPATSSNSIASPSRILAQFQPEVAVRFLNGSNGANNSSSHRCSCRASWWPHMEQTLTTIYVL